MMVRRVLVRLQLAVTLIVFSMAGPLATPQSGYCELPEGIFVGLPPAELPIEVSVGIFILGIEQIREDSESLTVDLVMVSLWNDSRLSSENLGYSLDQCRVILDEIWNPNVVTVNQRTFSRALAPSVSVSTGGQVRLQMRLSGEFSTSFDLRNFPFDEQTIRLQFASYLYGPDEVRFVVDQDRSGTFDSIPPAGWRMISSHTDMDVKPLEAVTKRIRFDHVLRVAREPGFYIWQYLVPLGLIVLMASSVFWIDPQALAPQLGIAGASTFTLIAFRLGLGQRLPPVPYLTIMDKMVLCATVVVFLALGEAVLTSKLVQDGKAQLAYQIDFHARWVYPTLLAGLLLVTLAL